MAILNASLPNPLCLSIAPQGNVGTGLQAIGSFVIPREALDRDGNEVEFEILISFAANDNDKRARIEFFNGTTSALVWETSAAVSDIDGGAIVLRVHVVRTSAGNQTIFVEAAVFVNQSQTAYTVLASGTAISGSTTTMYDSARTEAAGYWVGSWIEITSGTNQGQRRFISAFDAVTDTITFAPSVGTAISTDTYNLLSFPPPPLVPATIPRGAFVTTASASNSGELRVLAQTGTAVNNDVVCQLARATLKRNER